VSDAIEHTLARLLDEQRRTNALLAELIAQRADDAGHCGFLRDIGPDGEALRASLGAHIAFLNEGGAEMIRNGIARTLRTATPRPETHSPEPGVRLYVEPVLDVTEPPAIRASKSYSR